jgi:hypothetical protein
LLNTATDAVTSSAGLTLDHNGVESCSVTATSSSASFTTGNMVEYVGNNNSSAYLEWDCEIG